MHLDLYLRYAANNYGSMDDATLIVDTQGSIDSLAIGTGSTITITSPTTLRHVLGLPHHGNTGTNSSIYVFQER